jgi:hypothetical protein
MSRVLTDGALRAKMAAAARRSAERFSAPVVAGAYDETLMAALA